MSNKEDVKVSIIIMGFLFLIILTISLATSTYYSNKIITDIECNLEEIKLIDVRPNECWNNDFSEKYCPIPTDMKCNIWYNGNIKLLSDL